MQACLWKQKCGAQRNEISNFEEDQAQIIVGSTRKLGLRSIPLRVLGYDFNLR